VSVTVALGVAGLGETVSIVVVATGALMERDTVAEVLVA
jgi:hypothetical protein